MRQRNLSLEVLELRMRNAECGMVRNGGRYQDTAGRTLRTRHSQRLCDKRTPELGTPGTPELRTAGTPKGIFFFFFFFLIENYNRGFELKIVNSVRHSASGHSGIPLKHSGHSGIPHSAFRIPAFCIDFLNNIYIKIYLDLQSPIFNTRTDMELDLSTNNKELCSIGIILL